MIPVKRFAARLIDRTRERSLIAQSSTPQAGCVAAGRSSEADIGAKQG
jgi:hypothetical protein